MKATSLKDYQGSILDRLAATKGADSMQSVSYLGVIVAGKSVLVDMRQITETVPMMDIFPVPLVKQWFLGMANVRGVLYAVNDLGALLGEQATTITSDVRILLINNEVAGHVALLIDKVIGIRKLTDMQEISGQASQQIGMLDALFEDENNNVWSVLDCIELVKADEFLQPHQE